MELNKKETACVATHLMAFHRQAVFDRFADLGEPCATCQYFADCTKTLWQRVYTKMCKDVGMPISFEVGQYPLEPYQK